MYLAFFAALAAVFAPVSIIVFGLPSLRKKAYLFLPLGIGLNLGFLGFYSAVSFGLVEYGFLKYLLLVFLSGVSVLWSLVFIEKKCGLGLPGVYRSALILVPAAAALAGVADNFVIHAAQGWAGPDSYFRPPFNFDVYKDAHLVASFLRGEGNPYWHKAPLAYQTLWHHFASVVASVSGGGIYKAVQGVNILTAYVLFFLVVWAVSIIRPGAIFRPARLALALLVIFFHSDIFKLFFSFFILGRPAIEADMSFIASHIDEKSPLFAAFSGFANFSLKLVSLTSPQHALFLCFLVIFLVIERLSLRGGPARIGLPAGVFLSLGFVASPIFWALFFPLYFAHRTALPAFKRQWREALGYSASALAYTGAALALFWVVYGFPPTEYFFRENLSALDPLPPALRFASIPLLLIGSLGIQGLLATCLLASAVYGRRKDVLSDFSSVYLIAGGLVLNYAFTSFELRRHFAIVSSLVCVLFILKYFPFKRVFSSVFWKTALASVLVAGALAHGFMIYSFIGKDNALGKDIDFRDYFCVNDFIAANLPHTPVLGGYDFFSGVPFPPVMDVAPSFAGGDSVFVMSRLTKEQARFIGSLSIQPMNVVYAKELGFEYAVWGPIEKKEWGSEVRKEIIDKAKVIHACDSVSLLALPRLNLGKAQREAIISRSAYEIWARERNIK